MTNELNALALVDEACRTTGLSDFDGDSFREGLEILIGDVLSDTSRPAASLTQTRNAMLKALTDRLQVIHAWKADPAIAAEKIERPVFVLGLPRTGTTLLSNLLAADPDRRPLLTWEIQRPVPPPTSATLYTDPRAVEMVEAARKRLALDPSSGRFFRGSPIYPNEDVYVFAHDFKTLMWEAYGKLPTYRDWIFQTDVTSAYEYHRKFLQLHQHQAPGIWSLKMPSHALYVDTLLKVYPDARLIWTHRDPYAATASFCSLARQGHNSFIGKVDYDWIGQNQPWQAAQHVERVMEARDRLGEDSMVDVHYAEVMRDPLGAMRKLYQALGDEWTPQAEAGMQAWIDDNPPDKFGKHEYRLDEFGLSKAKLAPLFEGYLSRYPVESEDPDD